MKKIDLSIVIVSYNTADLLRECITSIISTAKKVSYEIIIVDNASADQTRDMIQHSFSSRLHAVKKMHPNLADLILIANKENLGFSAANNKGVNKSSGNYVLFLNPDTVVEDMTLDGMVDFMNTYPEVGASTCFVRMPNGKLDDAAHRGFPTPWAAFTHFTKLSKIPVPLFTRYNLSHLSLRKMHEIDALAGAFMIVRRDAGEKLHWWDEDYFWYGEDIDFCYRLKKDGWKIYFVPEFSILHYKGASGGIKKISKHLSTATSETQKKATDARFQAMRIFYGKHYKEKYPPLVSSLVLFGIDMKWRAAKLLSRI